MQEALQFARYCQWFCSSAIQSNQWFFAISTECGAQIFQMHLLNRFSFCAFDQNVVSGVNFFVAGFFERIRKWSQLNGRCIALSGVESLLEHSMNFCKYLSTCAFVFGKWKKSDLSTKPFKLDSHSNNVSFGTKEANFSFFFSSFIFKLELRFQLQ